MQRKTATNHLSQIQEENYEKIERFLENEEKVAKTLRFTQYYLAKYSKQSQGRLLEPSDYVNMALETLLSYPKLIDNVEALATCILKRKIQNDYEKVSRRLSKQHFFETEHDQSTSLNNCQSDNYDDIKNFLLSELPVFYASLDNYEAELIALHCETNMSWKEVTAVLNTKFNTNFKMFGF